MILSGMFTRQRSMVGSEIYRVPSVGTERRKSLGRE